MIPKPNRSPTLTTNSAAYTDLLQSAARSQSSLHVKQAHAHILKSPSRPSLFHLNTLLSAYFKCAQPSHARNLFDTMPQRNTVSYNSLITGYLQTGLPSHAMSIFTDSRHVGIRLDKFTYAAALNVCAKTGDLDSGKIIHGMVVVNLGLSHRRVFLTNSLIGMYSKCGEVKEARRVFDDSDELDDVSWNSMISAHEVAGLPKEALCVFVRMRRVGVELNGSSVSSVLKSCSGSDGLVGFGRSVHGCVAKVGLDLDVYVGSTMVDMYSKNGLLDDAVKFFKLMPDRNVVVFNAMIAGFCLLDADDTPNELMMDALRLFSELQRDGIMPSKFTFSTILRACNLNLAFEFGKQIHGHVIKANLQDDGFIGSALINMYSGLESVDDGLKCFHSIPNRDIVAFTSMISACVQNDQNERALGLFHELLAIGGRPDLFTICSIMSACANLAVSRTGEQIHSYAVKSGFHKRIAYGNSQIFMYAKSGDIDAAAQTFQEAEDRDVVSWSAMICSHAHHGRAREAAMLFKEMEGSGNVPNQVTFLGVLTACSHRGLVDEGLRYYKSMQRDYGIKPNAKHCACMVDLFGRSGRLAEAEEFLLDSGFDNDPVMWRALQGACRTHGDTVRGTHVADRVMELDPGASSSYVLLYNMHLDSGERHMAIKARDLMKEKGVKKEPGLSWIEIESSVHSFVAGDKSHPQSHAIYAKLAELLSRIHEHDNALYVRNEGLMNCHSEKLAVSLGMIRLPAMASIRVMKNLRICEDCHTTMKLFSDIERKDIVVRDPIRFHHFSGGSCSCGDYW